MASPTSSAGRFFEDFRSAPDRGALLHRLFDPADPQAETEWLDFKGARWNDPKRGTVLLSDGQAKEIWGQALSAFANTQGGVLVFGIDARKNANDVDAAVGFARVKDPGAFASRLRQLHPHATDPPVLGVEVEAWEDPAAAGDGAVLCHVPESPH